MSCILTKWPLYIILLLLVSCGSDDNNYTAYFSGQVKNARQPYLLFSRDNKVVDTIKLDKENHFSVKFDSLTPGMYSFKLEPDYQYIYFDKNDSLSVYIDANDFDKSIVFGGRGDRKNNFMMELFAMHEVSKENSYDIFSESPDKYTHFIDSTYALREKFYKKSKEDIQWSEGFDFYAQYRLNLNYYAYKEYYAYVHARRTATDVRQDIPKDFFSYRKKIDFNNSKLAGFSPFVRYGMALTNNLAYYKTFSKDAEFKENTLQYSINKLNIADSVFKNPKIKNQILTSIAFAYLLQDQNVVNNQKFLQRYSQLSTEKGPDNEIEKMQKSIKELSAGNKLPAIGLTNLNNKPFNIRQEIAQKTVVFFWTGCARINLQRVYDKITELKAKYKDIDFIGVNVDNDTEWRKDLQVYNLKGVQQLRATNFEELRQKWVLTKINRTIVLNADGTIKNAFTNLLDDDFVKELK
ncbi:TlpA family protein disulfide reductase [Flavobacterium sp. RHBU_3]|uniref:TlpA family protein disulfide reductase n=1 Tax=Flavobacterium sp. RHBU_3 TaxID=3391184 RepID=UPI003984CA8D